MSRNCGSPGAVACRGLGHGALGWSGKLEGNGDRTAASGASRSTGIGGCRLSASFNLGAWCNRALWQRSGSLVGPWRSCSRTPAVSSEWRAMAGPPGVAEFNRARLQASGGCRGASGELGWALGWLGRARHGGRGSGGVEFTGVVGLS
jgi:hypothetical protein